MEACTHLHRVLGKIRAAGGSPSVALNPPTPAEMIENVLDMVDHVLVMTVNPGFGGQAYIPTMVDKIKKIRGWIVDRGLDIDIEVDGGVKGGASLSAAAESYAHAVRTLYSEGGLARLYRGFLLYNLKAAPAAAVQFALYHHLKRLYASERSGGGGR